MCCKTCSRSKYRGVFSRGVAAISAPLACGSWVCPECGANRRERWLNRGKITFALFRKWQRTICPDDKALLAMAVRLRRKKRTGCYIRIHLNDGSSIVHHSSLDGTGHSPKTAFNLFAADVAAIPAEACDYRRVTCSMNVPYPDGWKKPISGWKIEAVTTKSLRHLNDKFRQLLIPFLIRDRTLFRAEYLNPLLDRPFDPELSDICRGNTMSAPGLLLHQPQSASDVVARTGNDHEAGVPAPRDDCRSALMVT